MQRKAPRRYESAVVVVPGETEPPHVALTPKWWDRCLLVVSHCADSTERVSMRSHTRATSLDCRMSSSVVGCASSPSHVCTDSMYRVLDSFS
jgi:hypothetical protein